MKLTQLETIVSIVLFSLFTEILVIHMIDINHDQSSIMGVFLSNHSWSRTHTGALSSVGNMCVYIQSQLITNRQRQGLFPVQGPAPN